MVREIHFKLPDWFSVKLLFVSCFSFRVPWVLVAPLDPVEPL